MRPMPSPRGTNLAKLFLPSNPRGAYDAALSEESGAAIYAFLQGKLSDEDLAEFCKLAGIDAGVGMDEPADFPGKPLTGGGKFGQDSKLVTDFNKRFPHAARIRVQP
jgi:hypothetical protein